MKNTDSKKQKIERWFKVQPKASGTTIGDIKK